MHDSHYQAKEKSAIPRRHHDLLNGALHLFAHDELDIKAFSAESLEDLRDHIIQDIGFLDARIDHINNTFDANSLLLETYETMKQQRETLLAWVETQQSSQTIRKVS